MKPAGGARVTVLSPGVLPQGVVSLPHGDIGRAGDVYLVDTTGIAKNAHASLYVTNLRDVSRSIRSFALPVGLWSSRGSSR